jgi:hypothetical protein
LVVLERWVGVALAATSVGQLVVAEWASSKTGEFARKHFNRTIENDTQNELGLPAEAAKKTRILDELYRTAELSADGSSVLAAELAAFAGLVVTCVIAIQVKYAADAWVSGIAALIIIPCGVTLIIHLLDANLSRYVIGEPRRDQRKTKNEEPSWWRRSAHNLRAAIVGCFHRLNKWHTLTPYKTSVIIAGIVSAVIGVLI